MKIRLGYVAISKTINTSFKTMTYTEYMKHKDFEKLDKIIRSNLETTLEILKYNQKNNIHFYRMTSNLIPLATKQDVIFDYVKPYKSYYQKIKSTIQKNSMRIDMHPDQYTVLNSTKKEVIKNTHDILKYHVCLLKEMGIKHPLLVLHIGSSVFGKEQSIKRFIHQFESLPKEIQKTIALENDDKIYTVEDVLLLCETLHLRMVLDYHHYNCNKEKDILSLLPRIFKTWGEETPKMHFSSPKNKTKKEKRSHHDYIDADEFIAFLETIKPFNQDIDIMLEAKEKDNALFKLKRELKYKTNFVFLDDTTFLL